LQIQFCISEHIKLFSNKSKNKRIGNSRKFHLLCFSSQVLYEYGPSSTATCIFEYFSNHGNQMSELSHLNDIYVDKVTKIYKNVPRQVLLYSRLCGKLNYLEKRQIIMFSTLVKLFDSESFFMLKILKLENL